MTGTMTPPLTAAAAENLPAPLRLLLLTDGKRTSQIVYVLAALGIADHVAAGTDDVAELAAKAGCDADALYRVMRAAATFGVFAETTERHFELTPLAGPLRSDTPDSQRDLVLYNGDELMWRPYGDLLWSVRTGKPAFEQVFGASFFEHLAAHPDKAELFNRAMTQMSRITSALLLAQYDFGRLGTVVDVGGGQGLFLAELLRRHRNCRGVLVDLPEASASAAETFATAGVTDRVTVAPGDFFAELPTGGDAYVLKMVLHDWADEDAVKILRRIRDAIGTDAGARLLVLEFLVGGGNGWDRGKLLDVDMLVRFGGRERTEADWRALLAAADFELVTVPAAGRWALLECRPLTREA